jgi:hypothetical protein
VVPKGTPKAAVLKGKSGVKAVLKGKSGVKRPWIKSWLR